jgi:hypothetical protein
MIWTGLIGTGLIGTGLIGTGLIGKGLIGKGLIGTGLTWTGLTGTGARRGLDWLEQDRPGLYWPGQGLGGDWIEKHIKMVGRVAYRKYKK